MRCLVLLRSTANGEREVQGIVGRTPPQSAARTKSRLAKTPTQTGECVCVCTRHIVIECEHPQHQSCALVLSWNFWIIMESQGTSEFVLVESSQSLIVSHQFTATCRNQIFTEEKRPFPALVVAMATCSNHLPGCRRPIHIIAVCCTDDLKSFGSIRCPQRLLRV